MRQTVALVASLAIASTVAPRTLAFCSATTCNLADPRAGCRTNSDGCETTGKSLAWASDCVSFAVHAKGSEKLGISARTLEREVERALARWTSAACDGGDAPTMQFVSMGAVECDLSEYNTDRANANIVLFEDEAWPYEGGIDTIATTRLRFNPDTGALNDADIQLNSAEYDFSVADPVTGTDLSSVLTHELGHLLGLYHSNVAGATMETAYSADDDARRSLEPDDVAGVCELYPPDRTPASTSCAPRRGFSAQCGADQPPPAEESAGCALRAPERGSPSRALVVALAALAAAWLWRRGRKRAA
jgi:MYXO-CTERM domain-containing protein